MGHIINGVGNLRRYPHDPNLSSLENRIRIYGAPEWSEIDVRSDPKEGNYLLKMFLVPWNEEYRLIGIGAGGFVLEHFPGQYHVFFEDKGLVRLPPGKQKLYELVKGDPLYIEPKRGEAYEVEYQNSSVLKN